MHSPIHRASQFGTATAFWALALFDTVHQLDTALPCRYAEAPLKLFIL
jgi:hypothetical protein